MFRGQCESCEASQKPVLEVTQHHFWCILLLIQHQPRFTVGWDNLRARIPESEVPGDGASLETHCHRENKVHKKESAWIPQPDPETPIWTHEEDRNYRSFGHVGPRRGALWSRRQSSTWVSLFTFCMTLQPHNVTLTS